MGWALQPGVTPADEDVDTRQAGDLGIPFAKGEPGPVFERCVIGVLLCVSDVKGEFDEGVAYAGIRLVLGVSLFVAASMTAIANGPGDAVVVEIDRGTVSFDVGTNIPAIRVHGKS